MSKYIILKTMYLSLNTVLNANFKTILYREKKIYPYFHINVNGGT